MPTYLRDSGTLILNLEIDHLKTLLKKREHIFIPYNGHHTIDISVFNQVSDSSIKQEKTVSYDESSQRFQVVLSEDDIPTNSMDCLTIELPYVPQKITTLIITCPFNYKKLITTN